MGVAARDPTLPRQRHRQILDQRRDADEINPDEAALSRAQVAAARQILAEDAA